VLSHAGKCAAAKVGPCRYVLVGTVPSLKRYGAIDTRSHSHWYVYMERLHTNRQSIERRSNETPRRQHPALRLRKAWTAAGGKQQQQQQQ
jgi:hypothetical protein